MVIEPIIGVLKMVRLVIPKWFQLIQYIETNNLSKLSRKLDITHSYTNHVTKLFVRKGLVKKSDLNGREYRYKLTMKGDRIRKACEIINELNGGVKFDDKR